MTKDELQAKRAVALSELKNIEVALCLDEHYIDIIEKENAEQKEKIEVLECDNYNANCNLNLITDQLTKAKELLKEAQGYIENIDDILYDEIEQFIKETEKC